MTALITRVDLGGGTPHWYRDRPNSVVHLIDGGARTVCGYSLIEEKVEEAPYAARCSSCLARVRRFASAATELPPERVRHTLILDIEAPADADLEELWKYIEKRKAWVVLAMRAESTEPVVVEEER